MIFTSDNGPWYGGSTGGLRGMKGTTWEGGYRVPFIARWPGRIPAGKVSAEPAFICDLYTTALKAANLAMPSDRIIDGKDITPSPASNWKRPTRPSSVTMRERSAPFVPANGNYMLPARTSAASRNESSSPKMNGWTRADPTASTSSHPLKGRLIGAGIRVCGRVTHLRAWLI